MHTRRTSGDNGYQTAEDFANQGRGYEPANHTDVNSVIHDKVDTVVQNGEEKEQNGEEKAATDKPANDTTE